MGNKGSIVCKEEIHDKPLVSLRVGLQPSEVDQAAIQAILDVDEVFVFEIFSGLFEYHAEEDGEEGWSQDTTLFHPICDGERLWQVVVQSDLTILIFMQLNDHVEESLWTAKSFQDQP